MKWLLGALVALSTLSTLSPLSMTSTARAEPLVPAFSISVPNPLTVIDHQAATHDLEVNYAFTQEDLINAQVEVDLPPGILVISVSDNQPFATHCTYQAPIPQGAAMDWRCVMSASLIDVGSGLSSRIVIRINPVLSFFAQGTPLTFTARLTADNLSAPIETSVQTEVAVSALSLVDYPQITDIGTVESPLGGALGIATNVSRAPYNVSTAFLGQGVEVRSLLSPSRTNYFLTNFGGSLWATDHVAWEPVSVLVARFQGLLGPLSITTYSTPEGHRAEQTRSGSGAPQIIWSECGDVITATDLSAETWAPISMVDPTLERKQLGQDETFSENPPSIFDDFDCGEPIVQVLPQNVLSVGGTHGFGPSVGLPMGAVPLYDLFVTVELDSRLAYRYPHAYTYNAVNGRAPVDIYACTFPSGDIDLARFLAERTSQCTFLYRNDDPLASVDSLPNGTTHVVAYEDVYFSDEPFGRTVYRYFQVGVESLIPCSLAGETLTHRSRAMARLTGNGTPVDTGWAEVADLVESDATLDDYGPIFRDDSNVYGPELVTVSRGSTFSVMSQLNNTGPGENPEAVYTLPPGIRLVSADWIDDGFFGYDQGNCVSPDMDIAEVLNPDGSTTVTVTLRHTGGADWFYVIQCAASDCAPAGRGDIRLQVYVDPEYPWLDGQAATFTSRWDIANNGWDGNSTQGSILVNVPDELRLRIDPFCDGVGGGCEAGPESGRRPGLRYTAENRSGRSLSDVVIQAFVPAVGDGSGSEVDATLFQIDNPLGLSLSCFDDNDDAVTCGPTTRRVMAVIPAMAPLEESAFGLVFEVDTQAVTGQRIYGRGSMSAAELAEVPAAAVAPIRVNLCPGRLEALVYFDDDGDGIKDSQEFALPGWSFTLTDDEGQDSTYEVGLDGVLEIAMANGLYEWSAARLETSQGVFALGGDLDPFVICADELTTLEVPVTCSCSSGPCEEASCDLNGVCTFVQIPGPLPGVLDDSCDWVDDDCDGSYSEDFVSYSEACNNGACTGTRNVSCNNNALQTGTCNAPVPQPEQCDGFDNDCDSLVDIADSSMLVPACTDPYTGGALQGVCIGAVMTLDMCVNFGFGSFWTGCSAREFLFAAYQKIDARGRRSFWVDPNEAGDTCDGLDNDCDGLVDEDFAAAPVTCACGPVGTTTCIGGIESSSCPGDPGLEAPLCANQQGVCAGARTPLTRCGESGWQACEVGDYAAHGFPAYAVNDAVCDGLDNDCDGQVDEEFVGELKLCPAGSCQPVARDRCVAGSLASGCEPSGPGCPTGPGTDCEACSPATALYIYGVAEDEDGVPQGSFRCTRSPEGVVCDVDGDGVLEVTQTLWCGP